MTPESAGIAAFPVPLSQDSRFLIVLVVVSLICLLGLLKRRWKWFPLVPKEASHLKSRSTARRYTVDETEGTTS